MLSTADRPVELCHHGPDQPGAQSRRRLVRVGRGANAVIFHQQFAAVTLSREADRNIAAPLGGEGVLDRIGKKLIDDEAKGDRTRVGQRATIGCHRQGDRT